MGRMDAAPLFSCACGHWAQMCVTVVACHRVVIRVVSVVRSVFQLYNKKGAVKHHGEADYPITCDALPHHLHHLCRLVHACLASSLLVQRWDSLLVRLWLCLLRVPRSSRLQAVQAHHSLRRCSSLLPHCCNWRLHTWCAQ